MYQLNPTSLTTLRRQEIIQEVWGQPVSQAQDFGSQDICYFEYFEDKYHLARQNDDSETPICSLQNIFSILRQIKAGVERATIVSRLSSEFDKENDEKKCNNAIHLVVRLYLMVHTGEVRRGVTSQSSLVWQEGSLKDAVANQFQHQLVLTDSVKFERVFNAKNVERIADTTIQWTPNLVDHLRFSEDGKKPILNIFHHALFLELHRDSNIFPPGFIDETIRTLRLLLPAHDSSTRKWFKSQSKMHKLDPKAITCGQLKLEDRQIEHFKYWHDRLVILKQYFDDSEPRTIRQWWFDDRKRVQWFWVAIVLVVCTVLFGIIQCIEGGWQIWKAYYPNT